jgi:hypothetical protein
MQHDFSKNYKGNFRPSITNTIISTRVADPDPNPDPYALGLLNPDPLVRGMDPYPVSGSFYHQAKRVKTLIPIAL